MQFVPDAPTLVCAGFKDFSLQLFAIGDIPFASLHPDLPSIFIKERTPCAGTPFHLPAFSHQAEFDTGIAFAIE